jgi:hypothetical protein
MISSGANEEELYQYVVYDQEKVKGFKRINLDDPKDRSATSYKPPANLLVHLSKIDMPELKPRSATTSWREQLAKGKGKEKEKRKEGGKDKEFVEGKEKGKRKEKGIDKWTRNDFHQVQ